MSFQALTSLTNLIVTIFFAVFIYSQNTKSPINKSYAFFTIFLSIWNLGYFLWQISSVKNDAVFWCRILTIGSILIPPTYLCFVTNLVGETEKNKKAIWISYLMAAFFLFFVFSPLLVKDVTPKLSFKFWPEAGPLYSFYIIYFVCFAIYALNLLIAAYRKGDSITRNRLKYVLIGTAIGYFGGSTNYPLWFNLNIYPFGNIFISLYVILVSYAIVRHQLMDIEVIIKKSLIFASLFTVILGIFVGITVLTQSLIAGSKLLGFAISSVVIILMVRPLEDFLIKITDKYLFQKKYDPLQLLKTFSDMVLASVLDQASIIKIAVDLLTKALSLENLAILLMNKEGDAYEIVGASGIEDKNISFSNNSHLIIYLNKTFSPIIKRNHDKTISNDLLQDMGTIKAEVCIPLVFHKNLVGFLAFGKKKSGNDYMNEDMNILVPLTRDIAIAIVYARLYEDVRQKDKLATLGTLVAGIKHEIGNPLSSILTSTQLFIRDMEEWNTLGLSQKEREEKTKNIINDVIFESRRIGRITRKFTDFARPGDEGVKEIVSIEDSLKEALEILENELSLKHIKIEKDIPKDMPKIYVDKDQIHQIFFNLLRNAAQAIEESNKPKEEAKISITVRRKTDEKVAIDISDTGCGISEEKKIKIFEPFYTTKERGKGTGLGLAIVQQLVGKNRGDISFKSQEGEGATFMLEFPIAKNG